MKQCSEQLNCFTKGAVAHTSRTALADLHDTGKAETQKNKVYWAIMEYQPITRNELSRLLNLGINVVCGRVNELIKEGAVIENGIKADKYSSQPNKKLYVRE